MQLPPITPSSEGFSNQPISDVFQGFLAKLNNKNYPIKDLEPTLKDFNRMGKKILKELTPQQKSDFCMLLNEGTPPHLEKLDAELTKLWATINEVELSEAPAQPQAPVQIPQENAEQPGLQLQQKIVQPPVVDERAQFAANVQAAAVEEEGQAPQQALPAVEQQIEQAAQQAMRENEFAAMFAAEKANLKQPQQPVQPRPQTPIQEAVNEAARPVFITLPKANPQVLQNIANTLALYNLKLEGKDLETFTEFLHLNATDTAKAAEVALRGKPGQKFVRFSPSKGNKLFLCIVPANKPLDGQSQWEIKTQKDLNALIKEYNNPETRGNFIQSR